jgi:hypothetical protein
LAGFACQSSGAPPPLLDRLHFSARVWRCLDAAMMLASNSCADMARLAGRAHLPIEQL